LTTAEREELARVRRENKQLRLEHEILADSPDPAPAVWAGVPFRGKPRPVLSAEQLSETPPETPTPTATESEDASPQFDPLGDRCALAHGYSHGDVESDADGPADARPGRAQDLVLS